MISQNEYLCALHTIQNCKEIYPSEDLMDEATYKSFQKSLYIIYQYKLQLKLLNKDLSK